MLGKTGRLAAPMTGSLKKEGGGGAEGRVTGLQESVTS